MENTIKRMIKQYGKIKKILKDIYEKEENQVNRMVNEIDISDEELQTITKDDVITLYSEC